jgi:chromosome segregation ATPase
MSHDYDLGWIAGVQSQRDLIEGYKKMYEDADAQWERSKKEVEEYWQKNLELQEKIRNLEENIQFLQNELTLKCLQ